MAGIKQDTVPLQPLVDYIQPDGNRDFTRKIRVDPSMYYRWNKHGIPIYWADHIACKTLGVHPAVIWKTDWFPQ